ncbi:MAG: hypothetical protein HQL05_01775 [Nitrospirae bacterium]|uniref:hypothetical protein n=1 Tax=Candidatus Magnetobacterium casense TaxID=1455061 RepID=UPI00058D25D0|nr:hypothetical protein [Candidatus Magnetobacterium casensis]MBF0336538.1 hypothetical protein [Nitrospirota bacterium]
MVREKNIEKLTFEENRCVIHLEDTPYAIIVHAIDGLVTLCEGEGDDRIHGFVLTPSGVIKFELELIEGKFGISLLHWRQKKPVKHFLGFVGNEESARFWVNRVNRIYERLENKIAEPPKVRAGSIVVGDHQLTPQ